MDKKAYWKLLIPALALCVIIAAVMLPAVFNKDKKDEPGFTDVAILTTTDMHGKCWETNVLTDSAENHNMLRVLTAVKQYREEFGRENTIVIDNGDLFQGTQVSEAQLHQYSAGKSADPPAMAVCLKEIGYDAFVLGNHEFNFDWKTMHDAYSWLEENGVPVLAANAVYDGTDGTHEAGESAFTPYIVKTITVGGHPHKIGILGLENTDISRLDLPANFPGMRFAHPGNDNYSISYEANLFLPKMKEEGCEFIIVSYHSGLGSAGGEVTFGVNSNNQGMRLAKETKGIDFLILGHDHDGAYSNTLLRVGEDKDLPVVNGGGQELTRTVFRFSENGDGELVWELLGSVNLDPGDYGPDKELEALIAPYAKIAQTSIDQPIGTAAGDWDESKEYFARQTDSIDLVTAAMIEIGSKRLAERYGEEEFYPGGDLNAGGRGVSMTVRDGAVPDHMDVDLAIANANTYDNYVVRPGDISVKDVYRLYRYSNSMLILPMYGREIRAVLEENAAKRFIVRVLDGQVYIYPGYFFTNVIFGGLNFTYDLARPEGERVQIRGFSNGREFEDDALYLAAVNSYMLGNEHGGLRDFGEGDVIWSQMEEEGGGIIQDIIVEYIQEKCEADGAITPDAFTWQWDIQYSADPNALPPYEGEIAARYARAPEEGRRYVIYSESECRTIAGSTDSGGLGSVYCESYGEVLTAPLSERALVFTVQDAVDGTVFLSTPDGRWLSCDERGNLRLAEEKKDGGLSQWILEAANGGYNIVNAAAENSAGQKLAVEYYNGRIMLFRLSEAGAFIFDFYEVEDGK